MIDKLVNWFTVEPASSMLMVITAILLFGSVLRSKKETSGDFRPWVRRIIEAAVVAAMFVGLLWAFRMLLNDNIKTGSM